MRASLDFLYQRRYRVGPHGHTLRCVWCAGIDANAEQVRRGIAWVFARYVKERSLYTSQDAALRWARAVVWYSADTTLGMATSQRRTGVPGRIVRQIMRKNAQCKPDS
jgi:hypothetical protein